MNGIRQITIAGIVALISMLAVSCSGGPGTAELTPQEAASAVRVTYSPAPAVVEAVRITMKSYGYQPGEPVEVASGRWDIPVESQAARLFDEKMEKVVVESKGPKKTAIYLILVDTAWIGRPGEPDWADSFITTVNETLLSGIN